MIGPKGDDEGEDTCSDVDGYGQKVGVCGGVSEALDNAGKAKGDGVEGYGDAIEDEDMRINMPIRKDRLEELSFRDFGMDVQLLFLGEPFVAVVVFSEFVGF